jgi:hypothetical protein
VPRIGAVLNSVWVGHFAPFLWWWTFDLDIERRSGEKGRTRYHKVVCL